MTTMATIYQSIQELADHTKKMALEHNYKMVEKNMSKAHQLYKEGNALVRGAIENVFVYSFSTLMTRCNAVEWRMVQSYMPSDLYQIYIRQVLRSN